MNNEPIILHVDLNSFFATAEQQANPYLRGKPVGILKAKGRACVIAASVEAKRKGVKTGTNIYDAKRLCPEIVLVPADFDKYADISYRFIEICKSYSPACEVFSLDECFIDLTESECLWREQDCHSELVSESQNRLHEMLNRVQHDIKSSADIYRFERLAWIEFWKSLCGTHGIGAVNIAFEIKRRLREEVGDYMSCSVGISYNRYLAKLGSNQIKPDGMFWIRRDNAFSILDKSDLMDICGLGYGLYNHLTLLGIDSFPKLRECSISYLQKHFGPYWSVHLYNVARGIDHTRVAPFLDIPDAKSVGRTYTTHRTLTNKPEVKKLVRNLCEEATAKARKMKLVGRYIGFSVRGSEHPGGEFRPSLAHPRGETSGWRSSNRFQTSWYGHITLKQYIDDGKAFFEYCMFITKDWPLTNVRFCGVTLGMLTKQDYIPTSLFPSVRRQQTLTSTIDRINDKYGDYTVFPGQLLGMPIVRPEVNGYFGDKKYRLEFAQKH